jgi:hypothetical protein
LLIPLLLSTVLSLLLLLLLLLLLRLLCSVAADVDGRERSRDTEKQVTPFGFPRLTATRPQNALATAVLLFDRGIS